MYDLLIQNNATKKEWVISGLENVSDNNLYFYFDDFEMPEDASYGEYTYALVVNNREDVEWELSDILLNSVAHTDDGDVKLRDLTPEIGLLNYINRETSESAPEYRDRDTEFYYRRKN